MFLGMEIIRLPHVTGRRVKRVDPLVSSQLDLQPEAGHGVV